MGNSTARNILDSYTAAMISVANNVIQDCDVTENQQQQIFINNCGEVFIEDINIARTLDVTTNCVQSSVSSNNIDQQLTQLAQQMATAINNNLNLTGTASADNITRLSLNLSDTIRNEATQNCSTLFGVRQSINIDCAQSPATTRATIRGIQNNTTGDLITNCLQTSNNVNNVRQQLQVIIDQKATAVVENGLIFIIYLVVGIILFYFIMKVNVWMAFVALILSIVAYFVTAYLFGLFPFDNEDNN